MYPDIDLKRGSQAARLLYDAFRTTGIHGHNEMPEDILPAGVERGSREHLIFITLTVSIDKMRDAIQLWEASRKTFEDPKTNYLYQLSELSRISKNKIIEDMQVYGLSRKYNDDADFWRRNGITFYKNWQGDPRNFLEACAWDALNILRRLKKDKFKENGEIKDAFPSLRGDKISPLWIRMLRDNVGISNLKNLDKVPIPVDKHIGRATLTLGIVRGQYEGNVNCIASYIHQAWFESVKGLSANNEPMIALDVDEPLWHLSKYGCAYRDKTVGNCSKKYRCELKKLCIRGKVAFSNDYVELDT